MPDTSLQDLLERNARHADALPEGYFDAVESGQDPAAVSICCSDSRVAQAGMWDVTEPGWLFTPSTIGNQVWDRDGDGRFVDGSVAYPLWAADTGVALVVGHTGCGAVTAALDAVRNGDGDAPAGVRKWVDLLEPVVRDGLADPRTDADAAASLVDQLVEYNVDRQVEFLRESADVPEECAVYGFVYDFQGVYDDARGRAYLVNADGETATEVLRDRVPNRFADHVRRLL